jgi:hypothetical protein
MVISRDQNAGRNHNIKIDNSSFDRVQEFKYLGKLTNYNFIQEEIKSRLKSGNSCYHPVQDFCLPVCYPKMIYRTIILPVVLYGCETWSLTLREEREWKKLDNVELRYLFSSPNIARVIKSIRME